MKERIIQIIPAAPETFVEWRDDQNCKKGVAIVHAWALVENDEDNNRDVLPLVDSGNGSIGLVPIEFRKTTGEGIISQNGYR